MNALLDASGITKSFSGIRALDNVALHVAEGERVGLIGPNGAGKTTLFNCILGNLRPDSGSVLLDGVDLGSMPVHRRARMGMGRTFQRIELFSDTTVAEHLLIAERVRRGDGALWKDLLGRGRPTPDESRRCGEILDLLGLAHLATEPIEALSLGQGRLVEVGRALVTEPKVLLLDEPSSGLDRTATDALAATLAEVQREKRFAVLLVEHDVELVAAFTQRTYVLDFGHLIADGPTGQMLVDDRVRSAYLGDLEVEA